MNTLTPIPASSPADRALARQRRIDAIRDGAMVRQHLGQATLHQRLPDGMHVVMVRRREFTGATLNEAIARAQAGEDNQP